jgi:hypothetical protein
VKKSDLLSINPQVLTGMGIDELEDRLEMQTLGLPVENALSDCGCIIIIIIDVQSLD